MPRFDVIHGDCLEAMRGMDAASVDAIVTDPPYGLSFMGKHWDHGVPGVDFWVEALRVAKPGTHLLAFGGTRTYHRLACAIEDAGWEVRDCIAWVYGSGFPKSLDVSKAIDKAAGAKREVIGTKGGRYASPKQDFRGGKHHAASGAPLAMFDNITAPATDLARQWSGWGTALKPAFEPIIVARKPLIGTVAENVTTHGTGAINVDGCRVGTEEVTINTWNDGAKPFGGGAGHEYTGRTVRGRWPANLIHDGSAEVVGLFPQTAPAKAADRGAGKGKTGCYGVYGGSPGIRGHNDAGGSAARFFYAAKASRRDREEGLEGFESRDKYGPAGKWGSHDCFSGKSGDDAWKAKNPNIPKTNHHPTVKPTSLMRYLCRLVTPPGGIVLDPFAGSGSTGKGAVLEGFNFIGIELEAEYVNIARARIQHAADSIGVHNVPL